MPIPDYQTIMLPLLRAIEGGQEHSMRALYDKLAEHFQLTDDERNERLPSGQQPVFHNRVGWAKTYLKKSGLLENPLRGKVSISERGRDVLAQNPDKIDNTCLEQFSSFVEFKNKSSATTGTETAAESDDVTVNTKTPLELLDTSYRTLQSDTADELLQRLKACSPEFFEHVLVQLLLSMGYGGGVGDGMTTKKSGDAGIDGVIKEDKLGLDVVCIQAKRWEGFVGRPIVQAFVGSMDYIRARKGVIITTSNFSRDAIDFVDKIEGKKVVLVHGDKLTQLMIDHDVGVTTTKVYSLKEVSHDFFNEDDS